MVGYPWSSALRAGQYRQPRALQSQDVIPSFLRSSSDPDETVLQAVRCHPEKLSAAVHGRDRLTTSHGPANEIPWSGAKRESRWLRCRAGGAGNPCNIPRIGRTWKHKTSHYPHVSPEVLPSPGGNPPKRAFHLFQAYSLPVGNFVFGFDLAIFRRALCLFPQPRIQELQHIIHPFAASTPPASRKTAKFLCR